MPRWLIKYCPERIRIPAPTPLPHPTKPRIFTTHRTDYADATGQHILALQILAAAKTCERQYSKGS